MLQHTTVAQARAPEFYPGGKLLSRWKYIYIYIYFFLKMQNLELKDPALVRIRGKIGILSKFEFYPMSEMYNCLLEFYWNFAVSVQKLFFL